MMKLIHEGQEPGVACDIIFDIKDAKSGVGHFGLLTKNQVTRTSGYKDGVISALSYFVHPDLH